MDRSSPLWIILTAPLSPPETVGVTMCLHHLISLMGSTAGCSPGCRDRLPGAVPGPSDAWLLQATHPKHVSGENGLWKHLSICFIFVFGRWVLSSGAQEAQDPNQGFSSWQTQGRGLNLRMQCCSGPVVLKMTQVHPLLWPIRLDLVVFRGLCGSRNQS